VAKTNDRTRRWSQKYLYVNALQMVRLLEDVRAVVLSFPDGIMVHKLEDPTTLAFVDGLLAELEAEMGLTQERSRWCR
jgi:citrate lyase beta subunit